jgi:hypothetical protein
MGNRKSSRIINMNYQYRFEEDLLKRKCIIESLNEIVILNVRVNQILDFKKFYFLDKHEEQSWNRIKQWVKENYPEYLI